MSEENISRKDFLKKGFFNFFNFIQENIGDSINILPPIPIRPPGAIEESKFLDTCVKCGKCVSSCEQKSIKTTSSENILTLGYPIIIPSERPCFVCDEQSCMNSCPTGALVLTPPKQIKMGIAIVNENKCITYQGKECDTCVKSCPFPSDAIRINENKHPLVTNSCIGCGLCEYFCDYKAIKIKSNR